MSSILLAGYFFFYQFHQGPALLKFTQRSAMDPDHRRMSWEKGVLQFQEDVSPAGYKLVSLSVKKGGYPVAHLQEVDGKIIVKFHHE